MVIAWQLCRIIGLLILRSQEINKLNLLMEENGMSNYNVMYTVAHSKQSKTIYVVIAYRKALHSPCSNCGVWYRRWPELHA